MNVLGTNRNHFKNALVVILKGDQIDVDYTCMNPAGIY